MHSLLLNLSLYFQLLGRVAVECGFVFAVLVFYAARTWARALGVPAPNQGESWSKWRNLLINFLTRSTSWLIQTATRSGPALLRSARWKNRLTVMVRPSSRITNSSARANFASRQSRASHQQICRRVGTHPIGAKFADARRRA
jgi:hypothetical protein